MAGLWRNLIGWLSRATPENPSFDLNSPDAWDALGAGEPASAGVRVSRKTALTYAAFWRCVDLISSDVAKLPLFVYRRLDRGKERDTAHPAYRLLRYKPNVYMTAFAFKKAMTACVLVHGNAYAYVVRDGAGRPLELLPLDPQGTDPQRARGVLSYLTHVDVDGRPTQKVIRAEDVLHLKGLGFDGLKGLSVIDHAREALGLGIAANKYGATFFRNNAEPSCLLEAPGKHDATTENAIRQAWERKHSGLDNAHRVGFLWGGLKLVPFSKSARESQLMELRQFQPRDICNFFGVPASKAQIHGSVSYNSLEQDSQIYLDDGLDPRLVGWEEECWDKLLSEAEKDTDSHVAKFERKALVRANLSARGVFYVQMIQNGVYSPNEIRDMEDTNPREGGDDYAPIGGGPNPAAGPAAGAAADEPPAKKDAKPPADEEGDQ